MSRARDRLILAKLDELGAEFRAETRAMNSRIDTVNTRLDTVIDSLADLRRDHAEHRHD